MNTYANDLIDYEIKILPKSQDLRIIPPMIRAIIYGEIKILYRT